MITALAIIGYFIFYTIMVYLCERFSPLLALGGLILILMVAKCAL